MAEHVDREITLITKRKGLEGFGFKSSRQLGEAVLRWVEGPDPFLKLTDDFGELLYNFEALS